MSQKIIMLEGPDWTGKTNIAHSLGKLLGIPIYRPAGQNIMRFGSWSIVEGKLYEGFALVDFLSKTGQSVIFDRSYPSEYVYSKVMNRKFHEETLTELDLAFASIKTKIVICYKSNLDGYQDDLIPKEQIEPLVETYKIFDEFTTCKTFWLDTYLTSLSEQMSSIVGFLQRSSR